MQVTWNLVYLFQDTLENGGMWQILASGYQLYKCYHVLMFEVIKFAWSY